MADIRVAGIVLAAGMGTRMKSDLPKALHAVCGLPMGEYAGRALREAGVERPVFVIGHGGDLLRAELGESYDYAYQTEQLGTAHACQMALPLLKEFRGAVFVSPGDAPLVTPDVYAQLLDALLQEKADCAFASCILANPHAYGRVVRDASGNVRKIVEELDATTEEKSIQEVCTSFYCVNADALQKFVPMIGNDNAKKEYYLTDLIRVIAEAGGNVVARPFEPDLLRGVNDRWQLAEAGEIIRKRILQKHALNGVTIVDIHTTHIGAEVEIAPESRIDAMTILEGKTKIGAGCHIGPLTRVADSTISDECVLIMSHVNRASLGEQCRVGPYANLRPGTILGPRVKIGNFVEVKNSTVGESASMSHLSYVGDAEVGARANIGAGTITCNYDGFDKHKTVIGEDAFVGSNSTLIAPVEVGEGAVTAAGSTITKDVPPNSLAVGRSRQENKEDWAIRWRKKKER